MGTRPLCQNGEDSVRSKSSSECLLGTAPSARHCAKCLACLISWNLITIPQRYPTVISISQKRALRLREVKISEPVTQLGGGGPSTAGRPGSRASSLHYITAWASPQPPRQLSSCLRHTRRTSLHKAKRHTHTSTAETCRVPHTQ